MVVDGWIYYCVINEDEYHIYRMKTDGTGKTKLVATTSTNFDVSDGWLYFTASGVPGDSIVRKNLSKTGTVESIYTPPFVFDKFIVDGSWLYVRTQDAISKIPIKKNVKYTEIKQLVTFASSAIPSKLLMVSDGTLFYDISEKKFIPEDETTINIGALYSVQLDGKNKKKLFDESKFSFKNMQLINGYIYFPEEIGRSDKNRERVKINELK